MLFFFGDGDFQDGEENVILKPILGITIANKRVIFQIGKGGRCYFSNSLVHNDNVKKKPQGDICSFGVFLSHLG